MKEILTKLATSWADRIPKNDPGELIKTILNWSYVVAGTVAVGFIIYAGVQYVTSQGDPGRTKKAQNTILYAVIGLLIVVLAAAFTNFIFGAF